MPIYNIVKTIEPDEAMLSALEHLPGEEQVRLETPGLVVAVRDIPEDDVNRQVAEISGRRHIVSIEPDRIARQLGQRQTEEPDPEMFASEAEARASRLTADRTRALIGIDRAHQRGRKGQGRKIFVLGTGIHPELFRRLGESRVVYRGFVTNDGHGVDDTISKHESWVISVIAAACPEAKIGAIKCLSTVTGSAPYSDVITAIGKAVEENPSEINLSLGGPFSPALNAACAAAASRGIRVVVAAGNEQRGKTAHLANRTSPASEPECLTVGAKASDLIQAEFSNIGSVLDLSAPGVDVECADPDLIPGFWDGTSMAAPYATAASALLDGDVKAMLGSCDDTVEPQYVEGAGMVDVYAAIMRQEPEEPEDERCARWEERADFLRKRINRLRRNRYRYQQAMEKNGC